MSFEDFWAKYPRHIAKKHAEKIWKRMSRSQQEQAVKALEAHVKLWAKEARNLCFIPHPGTWLNQERFNDEIEVVSPTIPTVRTSTYTPPPIVIDTPELKEKRERAMNILRRNT